MKAIPWYNTPVNKGLFITFEGTDGCGKTSVLHALQKNYPDALWTREPGGNGSDIAEKIRALILEPENTKMNARTEALLYAASRAQHIEEVILPALNSGRMVICDRFVDSSIVYQGIARKLGVDAVAQINAFATAGLTPDATIFLDVKPEVSLARRQKDSSRDMDRLDAEPLAFHQMVYAGYQQLIQENPDRFYIVNANQNLDLEIADAAQILEKIIHVSGNC